MEWEGDVKFKEGRIEMMAIMRIDGERITNQPSMKGVVGMTDMGHHNSRNTDFGLLKRFVRFLEVEVLLVISLFLVGPYFSELDRLTFFLFFKKIRIFSRKLDPIDKWN